MGAAGQRDVVEVDHVEALALENGLDRSSTQQRPAGEVREDRRRLSESAAYGNDGHTRLVRKAPPRFRSGENSIRIDRVHNRDIVAAPGQQVREAIDVHRVAAEEIRRIERGHHAESQRLVGPSGHQGSDRPSRLSSRG